jgi:hypothetical protein
MVVPQLQGVVGQVSMAVRLEAMAGAGKDVQAEHDEGK